MSRSYHKSNTMHHAYISWVCYFSNKKDKIITNRLFRRINKYRLKKAVLKDDFDNYCYINKTREVRNVYDFASDGLKYYFVFNYGNNKYHYWTEDEIKKEMRK